MTIFFRLLESDVPANDLQKCIDTIKYGGYTDKIHLCDAASFNDVPTCSFAYWVSSNVRASFTKLPKFQSDNRIACDTNPAGDDTRYFRNWWETSFAKSPQVSWVPLAKGGNYNPYFADLNLVVGWDRKKNSYHGFLGTEHRPLERPASLQYFFKPGLTWSRRSQKGLSVRVLPEGAIFAQKGPGIFFPEATSDVILCYLAILNSTPFKYLASLQMSFGAFEVGVIQRTPVPKLASEDIEYLSRKADAISSLKRKYSSFDETSHYFAGPELFLDPKGSVFEELNTALNSILLDVDNYCFNLYGFSSIDRENAINSSTCTLAIDTDIQPSSSEEKIQQALSWAVGVIFGLFDSNLSRIASGLENKYSAFEGLPNSNKAMGLDELGSIDSLLEILPMDDMHSSDIACGISSLLDQLNFSHDKNLSKWLKSEFFEKHLSAYTKSRRQAPIYWPLQTSSSTYTLWILYHRISEQTLYTCVNDFVEPKLHQVEQDLNTLRGKSTRSSHEEKELEKLSDLASELRDFRDELLRLAKFWEPNLNDGVQITAAPLWKLFQHKAWQKKLKETWKSLEKGYYDWAHLACSIWPERVLEKCHQDRSLAIAHDVEDVFWQEVEVPVKRGKKSTGQTKFEWQPKALSDAELNALIQAKIREMNA